MYASKVEFNNFSLSSDNLKKYAGTILKFKPVEPWIKTDERYEVLRQASSNKFMVGPQETGQSPVTSSQLLLSEMMNRNWG